MQQHAQVSIFFFFLRLGPVVAPAGLAAGAAIVIECVM